ncbi:hypothetical protein J3F83DRAFT_756733 [Trichoderma novae-zelandiae]
MTSLSVIMATVILASVLGFVDYLRRRRHERNTLSSSSHSAQPSQPILGNTLEHDGDSSQTMPPSYREATTAPEDTVSPKSFHLGLPCLCGPHQGCCRKHNSLRSPNRRLLEHPDICLTKAGAVHIKTGDALIGLQSALTLVPIHSVMAYHLSLDHLECIRGRLSPGTKTAFIPELSYEDGCVSESLTDYSWSNEIYFSKGSFLQKQEIDCYQSRADENRPESFTACPHRSLTISTPEFTINNNMVEVSARVTNHPPRCASHGSEKWSNFDGKYAQLVTCTICHADAECVLELHDRSLRIRYTCYRDLGPGVDSGHSKWLALLTGQGSPQREGREPEVYERVWHTANNLRRRGLYRVTHQTPNGVFNIGTKSY